MNRFYKSRKFKGGVVDRETNTHYLMDSLSDEYRNGAGQYIRSLDCVYKYKGKWVQDKSYLSPSNGQHAHFLQTALCLLPYLAKP